LVKYIFFKINLDFIKKNILYLCRLFFNKKTMQISKIKILFMILIISIFTSVNAVDLWDVKYDEATGDAAYWDMKANDNDLSAWSGINVTDNKSTYWNLEADGAEYDAAWSGNSGAVTTGWAKATPTTANTTTNNTKLDQLPTTWPKEILLLVLSLVIVWLFFVRKRKTI
jgi:hypothetical protein